MIVTYRNREMADRRGRFDSIYSEIQVNEMKKIALTKPQPSTY